MMRALLDVHDPASRAHLESALARRSWEIAGVDESRTTVDLFRDAPFQLVVLQETPAGAAAEVCQALRREVGGRAAYVVGIAWHHDAAAIRRLVLAGVDDIVAAPLEMAELETRIIVAEARIGAPAAGQWETHEGFSGQLGEIQRRFRIQQAFLEGLFESAPEGVVIVDEADRVVRINDEFTRLFGYTPVEVIGQSLNELIVPEELRTEGMEFDGGVWRGERVMIETVRRHRDGHMIDVSVLATPINVNGPVGAFGIYRDITEKKRREAALRESEARYRALFDQSPVGVFLCDRDLRITHCNEYLTKLIGESYDDIVGADLRSLRNNRLLPGIRAALGGEPAFYEGPYRARRGKHVHVSAQYAPLRNDRGEVIGGIGVLEDVSHRVTAETQLRAQAAEMERVNAALRERTLELEAAMKARSRLYTAMNHELRTPISAILLYQELLVAGNLGPLSEEQLRALEHSHTATRHLLDLVRDILDLSKIEAGKVSVEPEDVCIKTLLKELLASVSPLTERYGSRLTLDVEPEIGRVVTDPQRLRQILMNFVSNAAKYGRRNPIAIRCFRNADDAVVFEVVDRGIGIAEEDLEHIFEDFVQLGSRKEEGTGLGLAICRRLTELLGAALQVESELEVGSTFRLTLLASDRVEMPLPVVVQ